MCASNFSGVIWWIVSCSRYWASVSSHVAVMITRLPAAMIVVIVISELTRMRKAGARRSLIVRALAHRSMGPYLALHSSGICPSAGPANVRMQPDRMIALSFILLFTGTRAAASADCSPFRTETVRLALPT